MQIIIHRGTHQIGGVATEIRTAKSRIIIDMGNELSEDESLSQKSLSISGVTDANGTCDGVIFTHYHGDHIGQLKNIRKNIPLYMGAFAKDIILATTSHADDTFKTRVTQSNTFTPGEPFLIGDITITPFSVDHSACDSYMFLIKANGKCVLHTGDFRMHGFRGKAVLKILETYVGKVDALIIEGTTLSRSENKPVTEQELQQKVKAYMEQYKYVFVLCASTNLERICALSKAVPRGKYFLCDEYQKKLLDLLERHWGDYASLYRNIKCTVYGDNIDKRVRDKGFLMTVRCNSLFTNIIRKFDPAQSIILYSMWDGYRAKPGSAIPAFLELTNQWEYLHTSGHVSKQDMGMVIQKVNPTTVIPIHTENPEAIHDICENQQVAILNDGEMIQL